MIQWKPFGPWATAAFALLTAAYIAHFANARADKAQQDTAVAVAFAQAALDHADSMTAIAADASARADSIEHVRVNAAPRVAAIVKAAPDTCKPVIAALQGQVAQLQAEAAARKDAYTEQKQATAVLAPATEHVVSAAEHLAKASKGSFLSHLVPKIGVGAAAGISAIDRRPDAVIGVTLSWGINK